MGSRYTLKGDLILAAAVLAAALILFGVRGQADGNDLYVTVSVGGEIVTRLPLNADTEYLVSTEYGENLVSISSGRCAVISSDCPGRDCVKGGYIERPGECIICAPHRVVVAVEGSMELDAVSE